MPTFIARLVRKIRRPGSWAVPLLLVTVVFTTSWALMALAEPGNPLVAPDSYWWWFLITGSTVGYGDLFPESLAGRVVGGFVVVGGIATLTTVFTRIAEQIENARGRRMQGLAEIDASDHVVILGYTAGRTERLVEDLLTKGRRSLVLCAWEDSVEEHPMATREEVGFVRGDLLDDAVLRRARLAEASVVLIDPRDDNEAVSMTVAAEHVAPGVHTVVALRDLTRARTIRRIDDTVRCVQWHAVRMITDEVEDPGISLVFQQLMTQEGGNSYSVVVPDALDGRPYGDLQEVLGRHSGATLLAVLADGELRVSPAWDTRVRAGATLYYVAAQRIGPDAIMRLVGDRAAT